MARYHGKKGVLYISTSASGTASAAIGLSTWSLNMATDKVDVSAFGDTNKTYVQGLKDLQGAFSGFWDDTETKVFGAADSADGCKLYLYPSSDAPTKYWYGTAWLDASIDTGVSAAVAISGTFVAASSWSRM
jgi:hypothetical protein